MLGDDLWTFEIEEGAFDSSLLPPDSRTPNTPEYHQAVRGFLERNLATAAGWFQVTVEDNKVRATWKSSASAPRPIDEIIKMLSDGRYAEAIQLLRMLLPSRPTDPVIHFNLGMALSDVGDFAGAGQHLATAVELDPELTNARVALGVCSAREGNWEDAAHHLQFAIEQEPTNGYALRNLGACFTQLNRLNEAENCFRQSVVALPQDQRCWLGLGDVLDRLGRGQEADVAYRAAIDVNPFNDLSEMARAARRKIAEQTLHMSGHERLREDAVAGCVAALQRFSTMSPEQVRAVAFEIAALGTKGINPYGPEARYRLRTLDGEFTGMPALCLMYVGLQQTAPEMDMQFDLAEEYTRAKQLFEQVRTRQ
jgi:Flp pilus assembly protein TadD